MDTVYDVFAAQMKDKNIEYIVETKDLIHRGVVCDAHRLERVLFSIVSNAWKFTPEGGKVRVSAAEEQVDDVSGVYVFRIEDTGIGMSRAFAAKVFNAFERERVRSRRPCTQGLA